MQRPRVASAEAVPTAPVLLTAAQVRPLGTISARRSRLWDDCLAAAARVHQAADFGALERTVAWHSLMLCAANFKAQLPVVPEPLPAPAADTARRVAVPLPGPDGAGTLARDDPGSWRQLSELVGLRVPRASAVLAALWPERHAVIDWRALSAAFALAGPLTGWPSPLPGPDTTAASACTWSRYEWYRAAVLATASAARVEPVRVERSLYQLSRLVPPEPGRTWAGYSQRLHETLAAGG